MKDSKKHRLVKWLINTTFIAVICIPIVLFVIWIIGGFLVIVYEDEMCAKDLNNPFINADYHGWHTVELINEEQIMLPDGWQITTAESVTTIIDENNNEIAKGRKLLYDENGYYQYEKTLSELLALPVSIDAKKETENVRSSVYGKITFDNSTEEYDYFLVSKASSYDMLFIFDPAANKMFNDVDEISEAIIFSYVYR